MSEYLGINLKLFYSHYRSTSGVCRQLVINRARFNKYLSGQSQSTLYNRERIGDSFGVEDCELSSPPEQLARLIGVRANAQPRQSSNDLLLRLLQSLRTEAGDLSHHCGHYFEYISYMSVPGSILFSLVHLYGEDGVFLFERQERQGRTSSTDAQAEEWARCRYFDAAFQLQDRVFLIDYESLAFNEMSQIIPIPSFKSRITRLNGLKTSVSNGDRWTPVCSRVVWGYLGVEINRINAYRQVRLYHPGDPRIDEDIRQRLAVGGLQHELLETE